MKMKSKDIIGDNQNPIQETVIKYARIGGPHSGVPKEYARTPIGKLPVKYQKNFEWLLGKEWWLSDAEELREKGYDPNIYAINGGEICLRANLNCSESHDDLSHWEDYNE